MRFVRNACFRFTMSKILLDFCRKFLRKKQSLVITNIGIVLKYFMKLVMVFDIFFACGKFRAR